MWYIREALYKPSVSVLGQLPDDPHGCVPGPVQLQVLLTVELPKTRPIKVLYHIQRAALQQGEDPNIQTAASPGELSQREQLSYKAGLTWFLG